MKLFYRQFGSGEPVIILHGVFGMSDNWVTIGRRLGEHFSVFIPDQRNHGQSPHSTTHNYYALADDVLEFMDEHGLREASVVGHSMGGKVAMSVALEASLRICKLIIIDVSPKGYPLRREHLDILRAMRSVDLSRFFSRHEVETELNKHLMNERISYFVLKNLHRDHAGRFSWRINVDALQENLEGISGALPMKGLYKGPVLVIRGGDSDYVTDADKNLISEYFPNHQLATIPGASHWVHADRPDALFAELMTFLDSNPSPVST